jgi:PTH1 family peptidyl-tRNA hydrolase
LGNPGAAYADTRHNVGWWALEHAQREWRTAEFRRVGPVRISEGDVGVEHIVLIEPLTYMNLSGRAVAPLLGHPEIVVERDLLVVVDDAALDVGRIRVRASGSAGGHNGLRSIEGALGSGEYARLRIGVGQAPPDVDLADWVLSPFTTDDEEMIRALLPDITTAMRVWVEEGVAAAANRFNR